MPPRVISSTLYATMPKPKFSSVGVIARELQVPLHRVEYVARVLNLNPQRVGNARAFDETDVAAIRNEIARIDRVRRGDVHAQ